MSEPNPIAETSEVADRMRIAWIVPIALLLLFGSRVK